ncbi:hypothetical protein [Solirubrum puertoriconensis]|uniref:Uncharacterized protein n=1 Tax=Solirubrum puertoriconensis TaxID=1751427 RepID=A0A9X0L3T4_SOLP1|nr:hypothetical protein [Solirubrum puertoriconensis]KUG06878.1 hypothetical protein ASU33_06015 [Solirubrum puertoriconensis]
MSQLLITKTDFPAFYPLSINVADELVNPYIGKAQTFDVRSLLTAAEWAGFERNLGNGLGEFPGIEFDPADFLATPPASSWDDNKLAALWNGFVRPLLVCESFRRLFLWHGTHMTQNGVEVFTDLNSQPISAQRRAELKADIEADRSLYRGRLEAALRAYRGTTTTTCHPTRRRPGRGGLHTYAV